MFPLNQRVQTPHQLISPASTLRTGERELSFEELLRDQLVSFLVRINPCSSDVAGLEREPCSNGTFRRRREHGVIHQPPKHTHSQTLKRFECKLSLQAVSLFPRHVRSHITLRFSSVWSVSINNLGMVNIK